MNNAFKVSSILVIFVSTYLYAHDNKQLPPGEAPDGQTESFIKGTRPSIDKTKQIELSITVVDKDSRSFIPHRIQIFDQSLKFYPPNGHEIISIDTLNKNPVLYNLSNISFEPDVVEWFNNKPWHMIETGQSLTGLESGKKYIARIVHGVEYEHCQLEIDLTDVKKEKIEKTVELKRIIDMEKKGWMSMDSHVHSFNPKGAYRQMAVEDIDYVNLMFVADNHPLYRKGHVTGRPAIEKDKRIVFVSQEQRDNDQGHMTLMGMKQPIQPITGYTGTGPPDLPNEPLNWEVWEEMHQQGGMAFHAHVTVWNKHGLIVCPALNKLDGVESQYSDLFNIGETTDQFIRHQLKIRNMTDYFAGSLWYQMLNCGVKLPLIAGTDKMSVNVVLGATARCYVKVPQWNHDGLMEGLKNGATFITNGPMLMLKINGSDIGSEIILSGEGSHDLKINASYFSNRDIDRVELIKNGMVEKVFKISQQNKSWVENFSVECDRSAWFALRLIGKGNQNTRWNWDGYQTAAHTSPIYVTINKKKVAVGKSAKYMIKRSKISLEWARNKAIWSSKEYKQKALEGISQALEFYSEALERSDSH